MKYRKGDLITLAELGAFSHIVHGCNIHNTMGSGIAKQIANRYPKAMLADFLTQKGDFTKLGCFTAASVYPPNGSINSFTIINAYTQPSYGRDGLCHVSYDALARVFKQLKLLYDMNPMAPAKIGIPKIGAGLGGGDWERIEEIVDSIGFSDITCVEWDQ